MTALKIRKLRWRFGADTPFQWNPANPAFGPKEIIAAPRSWCEASFNVVRWTDMPRGGHFAALEQPELLVEDIRTFYRRFRE